MYGYSYRVTNLYYERNAYNYLICNRCSLRSFVVSLTTIVAQSWIGLFIFLLWYRRIALCLALAAPMIHALPSGNVLTFTCKMNVFSRFKAFCERFLA
jgi:hypothetical protein